MCSARNDTNGTVAGHGHGQFLLYGLKNQAVSFLHDRLRTARLALTDATPTLLLTEEVTNGNSSSLPDARTLRFISRAAFDRNDYCRIVEALRKRLSKFDKKLWREPYKALILLEHLLTHGPEGVADEFRAEAGAIGEMSTLQHIDEKGFNWGLAVKNKSERVLKLIEEPTFLIEQRNQAQKVSHEIRGFGSFNLTLSSTSDKKCQDALPFIARSNSHYESCSTVEDGEPDGERDWKSELGNVKRVPSDKGLETYESEPFLAHREEPKVNLSQQILNCDDQQEKTDFSVSWKAEFGHFKGISCESEPFLAHQEEPKTRNVSHTSLNCGVEMNKRSEFRHWPAKDTTFAASRVVMDESERLLPRREEKRINKVEMLDHPFDFDHQGREELLLLSS